MRLNNQQSNRVLYWCVGITRSPLEWEWDIKSEHSDLFNSAVELADMSRGSEIKLFGNDFIISKFILNDDENYDSKEDCCDGGMNIFYSFTLSLSSASPVWASFAAPLPHSQRQVQQHLHRSIWRIIRDLKQFTIYVNLCLN